LSHEGRLLEALIEEACCFKAVDNLGIAVVGAIEGMRQFEGTSISQGLVIMPKRAPQWRTAVGGARRYPNALITGVA
jgi:hypothetical protein